MGWTRGTLLGWMGLGDFPTAPSLLEQLSPTSSKLHLLEHSGITHTAVHREQMASSELWLSRRKYNPCNYLFQLSNNEYILSLLDWQQQPSEDLFTQLEGSLGFFPGLPIGQIPQNGGPWRTYSADGAEVGPTPYWSGLINGRGRHASVSYNQSRLTIFNVNPGNSSVNVSYRFRMIGAQSLFAYHVSISDHKLTIIPTDGTQSNLWMLITSSFTVESVTSLH